METLIIIIILCIIIVLNKFTKRLIYYSAFTHVIFHKISDNGGETQIIFCSVNSLQYCTIIYIQKDSTIQCFTTLI